MDVKSYLSTLKTAYSRNYDLTSSFLAGGHVYPVYGHFASSGEKYVLSERAKLWEYQTYEHLLVIADDDFTAEKLEDLRENIVNSLEPELVRGGNKYPPKNHMMTYLTFAILSEKPFSKETLRAVKKFSFNRDYLFTIRGRMETHLFAVDLSSGNVVSSRAGKRYAKSFSDIYLAAKRKPEGEEKK